MSTQHNSSAARWTGLLSFGAASALVLAPVQASAAPAELETIAEAQGIGEDTLDASVEVNEVARDSTGEFVTLVYTIEYQGSDDLYLGNVTDNRDYGRHAQAGTALADSTGQERYYPLANEDEKCLCTIRSGSSIIDRLGPDESVTYWAMYMVPEDVDAVDVEVPEFGELADLPLD